MAFCRNINIEKIILPGSVTLIEGRAFLSCRNLKEIVLPDSIFSIGAMAFGDCTNLERIKLPKGLRRINVNLFSGCESLKEVIIPDGVIKIESECFTNCRSLREIVIPASVKCINGFPFYCCNLEKIIFEEPNNMEEITNSIFYRSEKVPEIVASDTFKRKFEKYLSINEVSSNGGGCYIATCVYGSYNCPQVWALRRYRDYVLSQSWYGRIFIKCYYKVSPILVRLYGDKVWFRNFWKLRLDKTIDNLIKRGIKDTFYNDVN